MAPIPSVPLRAANNLRRRFALATMAALAASLLLTALPVPAGASAAADPSGWAAAADPSGGATTTAISSTTDMAALALRTMNADRVAHGLVAYRPWGSLTALAGDRAQRMADLNTLSHDAAGGNVGNALTSRNIGWMSFGEIIGESSYPWGSQSVLNIYSLWEGSPLHRAIMFSSTYNYAGVGIAQGRNGTTWISVVFTESADHTRPVARSGALKVSGTTIAFSWSGYDRRLQSHTAGLRSFDVQLRVDGGTWRTIRNDTTATAVTLRDRAWGHTYGVRVQAADRRGTLSQWTTEKKVLVP